MIATLFNHIFEWDREDSKGQQLFFRLLEFVVLFQIIRNIWKWAFYVFDLTDVILPLGIANYLDVSQLFGTPFPYLNAGLITLLLIVGFTRRWKFAYLVAIFFFHLQYATRYSQGEISHGSNLAGMMLLCMAVSFAFFKEDKTIRRAAFGMIFFFGGFGYVSAGLSKMIGTGITWPDGNHLQMWIAERSNDKLSQRGEFELSQFQHLLLDNWWLSTMTLGFGLLTELTGFLMWFRKTRWIQATLLLGMHIGIVYTLNIYFGDYVYLIILIGYPWDIPLDWLWNKYQQSRSSSTSDETDINPQSQPAS